MRPTRIEHGRQGISPGPRAGGGWRGGRTALRTFGAPGSLGRVPGPVDPLPVRRPSPLLALLGVLLPACAGAAAPVGPDGLPARAHVAVVGRPQARPLSCESRSACDLLGWAGRPMEEERFRAGLPPADNPDLGFVGDVDGPGERLPPEGYGVHEGPIARRLAEVGLACRARRGLSTPELRAEVAAGRPVIVWATAQLDAPRPARLVDSLGRPFEAVRGEHTYLVVGYAPGEVALLDPTHGREKRVPTARFERSWAVLGRRAVTVGAPPAASPSP